MLVMGPQWRDIQCHIWAGGRHGGSSWVHIAEWLVIEGPCPWPPPPLLWGQGFRGRRMWALPSTCAADDAWKVA